MAAVSISPIDLEPFATIEVAKAEAMIEDALALAARVAPCINDETLSEPHAAAAKAIIRAAVLRRNDSGTGAIQSQNAGPYGVTFDNRSPHRRMFQDAELDELRDICREHNGQETGAFSVDTYIGGYASAHADICALNFGALYCSCGAVLTNELYPLYEV